MDDPETLDDAELKILPGSRSPLGPDRVVPRGRHGHPREEIRNVHRARLLDAFVVAVGRARYDATRVVDVCHLAGVSNRAFYATFADKEDCYLAAFDLGSRLLIDRSTEAYRSAEGPWEQQLAEGVGTALRYLAANPPFARFCTVEVSHVGPAAVARLNAVIGELRRAFGGDGEPNVPESLHGEPIESLLIGAAIRPIFTYIEDGRVTRLPELAPQLVEFMIFVVLGGGGCQAGAGSGGPTPLFPAHSALPPV